MHQTLEVRLAAAENEIKSAEQEKIEKEKAAVKALADQELIMEKVVQESKILKQQAEDNAMVVTPFSMISYLLFAYIHLTYVYDNIELIVYCCFITLALLSLPNTAKVILFCP